VVFVDAYAETGLVGIEALSRGASRAVFLEKDRRAVEIIRDKLASLGLQGRAN
jgi:16S rRNA (guanine966-N2)-methyltransferase